MIGAESGVPNTGPSEEKLVVLVVDDERPLAEVLAGFLSDLGYLPVMANHGRQALDLARVHSRRSC